METILQELKKEQVKSKKQSKKKEPMREIRIKNQDLFDKVKSFAEVTDEKKDIEVRFKELNDSIKKVICGEYNKLYEKEKTNPGSLQVEVTSNSGGVAQISFIPQDAYNKIDEKKANELIDEFGKDVVEEKDVVEVVDVELFKKHEPQIRAFLESINLNASDFFKVTTDYSVKKGTLDKLLELGGKKSKCEQMMDRLKVITAIKDPVVVNDEPPRKAPKRREVPIRPTTHRIREKA
jgi:hypothetical protein